MYCPQPLENHGLVENKKTRMTDAHTHSRTSWWLSKPEAFFMFVGKTGCMMPVKHPSLLTHPPTVASSPCHSTSIICHPVHQSWTRLLSYCFSTSISVSDLFLILFYYLFSVRFLLYWRTACLSCMHLVPIQCCGSDTAVHEQQFILQHMSVNDFDSVTFYRPFKIARSDDTTIHFIGEITPSLCAKTTHFHFDGKFWIKTAGSDTRFLPPCNIPCNTEFWWKSGNISNGRWIAGVQQGENVGILRSRCIYSWKSRVEDSCTPPAYSHTGGYPSHALK